MQNNPAIIRQNRRRAFVFLVISIALLYFAHWMWGEIGVCLADNKGLEVRALTAKCGYGPLVLFGVIFGLLFLGCVPWSFFSKKDWHKPINEQNS